MRRKSQPVAELKFDAREGSVEGHGAVFDNVDFGGDKIVRGAFAETLRSKRTVPMLWQHRDDQPIGLWHHMSEDDYGLKVRGRISDTVAGRDALTLLRDGVIAGLSIGYRVRDYRINGDVRELTKIDLLEVSVATFPMNPKALVSAVKASDGEQLELAAALDAITRTIDLRL